MRFLFLFLLLLMCPLRVNAAEKIDYWNSPLRGGNCCGKLADAAWFEAAREKGVTLVRVAPNRWKTDAKDFLVGDAKNYVTPVKSDIGTLRKTLDEAERNKIKVVLTTLSLPGTRWRQQNDFKDDSRLWREEGHFSEVADFWQNIAKDLSSHPALIGYDIVNEPHPEMANGFRTGSSGDIVAWSKRFHDTPADLNRFYKEIVKAIREVDKTTPIVVESGDYAGPWAFSYLTPLSDDKVIYSFHFYEPFEYTNRTLNKGQYRYPGEAPVAEGSATMIHWDKAQLQRALQPVTDWQKKFNIPSNRIFVGEFGVNRSNQGAANYLKDVTDIFNNHGWHWAFYAFREDTWPGMDYELGTQPLSEAQWKKIDAGETIDLPRRDKPLFEILKRAMHQVP